MTPKTPLPWKWTPLQRSKNEYEKKSLDGPAGSGTVLQGNYQLIGYEAGNPYIDGYPEDFAFIETACNSHQELVDALRGLVAVIGLTAFKYESQRTVLQDAIDIAVKAIEKTCPREATP